MPDRAARHLHLDLIGGIAGDMFVAAMLDAAPELLADATELAARIGPGVTLSLVEHKSHGLRGKQLRLDLPGKERGPRHYGDYLALLRESAPDLPTAERASDILRRLGEAEAGVHGMPLDRVHFHEISDWDSVADILISAWLIEARGISTASTGPIPTGSGRINTEHGVMPVPAPATARLLQGFAVFDDGIAGERVTPTGAAILAHLQPVPHLPGPAVLQANGYGFGTKEFPEIANMLRVGLHEMTAQDMRDRVGVITFQVDDQTAEDLAIGIDLLRLHSDVLDVLQMPCFTKKGRMATRLEVLCSAEAVETVADRCFLETTTIGLRIRIEERRLLPRLSDTVALQDGSLRLKRVRRPDGNATIKPESDDLASTPTHSAREALRAKASTYPSDDDSN